MICPNCHVEIPANSRFCLQCGSQVSSISGHEAQPDSGNVQEGAAPGPTISFLPTLVTGPGAAEPGGFRNVSLDARYEILHEVDKGGYGVVYKARDMRLDRIVAIKRLHDRSRQRQGMGQVEERFLRESKVIAKLNHRNIVQVFDTGKDDEGLYIVMEYVEGGSLRQLLNEHQKLPVKEALAMARCIAQGLAHAHRRNLVHRDIKPGNILLARSEDGVEPKIVDFGLAREGQGDSGPTLQGFGMGTPFYMPPEQRQNAKTVNQTADVYALGKLLYEMITGEVPENVLPHRIPAVPGLAPMIFKCIESRPEERYFSMDEVIAALDAISGGGAVAAKAAPLLAGGIGTAAGYCPVCGTENEEAAKFCVGCGQGLFRKCPECERETRTTLRFCSACGTDIDGFEKLRSTLQNMREYTQGQRWSRVVKEAGLLQEMPRLSGEAGRRMLAEFEQLRQQAIVQIEEIRQIEEQIAQAIDGKRLEEALRLINQCQGLDPANPDLAKRAADILAQIDNSDYADTVATSIKALQNRELSSAIKAFHHYIQGHARGLHAQEASDWIQQRIPDLSRYLEMLDLDAWMGHAYETGKYAEAEEAANRQIINGDNLDHADWVPEYAADILGTDQLMPTGHFTQRARQIVANITEKRNTARRLIAEARQLIEDGGFEAAAACIRNAAESFPATQEERQLLANTEAQINVQHQHVALFRQLVTRAGQAIRSKRLIECQGIMAHAALVRQQVRRHETDTQYSDWAEACRTHDELDAQMHGAAKEFRSLIDSMTVSLRHDCAFRRALDLCAQAEAICTDSQDLVALKTEALDKQNKLDALLRSAHDAFQARKWTPALQFAQEAVALSPANSEACKLHEDAGRERAGWIHRQSRRAFVGLAGAVALLLLAWIVESAWIAYNRKQFQAWQGRAMARARTHAERIIDHDGEAATYIAEADALLGARENARDVLARLKLQSIAIEPAALSQADAWFERGEQSAKTGRFDLARSAWSHAVSEGEELMRMIDSERKGVFTVLRTLDSEVDSCQREYASMAEQAASLPASGPIRLPALASWTNLCAVIQTWMDKGYASKYLVERQFNTNALFAARTEGTNALACMAAAGGPVKQLNTLLATYRRFAESYGAWDGVAVTLNTNLTALFQTGDAHAWNQLKGMLEQMQDLDDPGGTVRQLEQATQLLKDAGFGVFRHYVLSNAVPLVASGRMPAVFATFPESLAPAGAIRDLRDKIGALAFCEAMTNIRRVLRRDVHEAATNVLCQAARLPYAPAQGVLKHYASEQFFGLNKMQGDNQPQAVELRGELDRLVKKRDHAAAFAMATVPDTSTRRHDQTSTLQLYRLSAEAGFAPAMVRLSDCLLEAEDHQTVAQTNAMIWLQKAADLDDTVGMLKLGMNLREKGAYRQAVQWFERAAVAGDPAGYREKALAFFHYTDKLDAVSDDELIAWMTKAADDGGDADAMFLLGCFYNGWLANKKDLKAARHWMERAKAAGVGKAAEYLKQLPAVP